MAGQTALQAVHGSVQQLHSDAPGPEELAGGGGATFRRSRRRRSHLFSPSLPIGDIHPDIGGRTLCERDTNGGQRVQVSHRVTVAAHAESRIQVLQVFSNIQTSVLVST